MRIDVRAIRTKDGDVRCTVKCDDREAVVIFTDKDVILEVSAAREAGS